VRVRTVAAADLEASLDLFEAVCAEGRWLATESPIDRREVRRSWEALLASGDGTVLVAEEAPGAPPAGLLVLVGRARPELGMLVAEAERRRGVGAALLREAIAWARAACAAEIVLHVSPHNAAALALYRKLGFEDRGLVRRGYLRRSGERWDAHRMVLTLDAGAAGS
jgi:[ribosomal protein S18]-alanine N-acetyltransferase